MGGHRKSSCSWNTSTRLSLNIVVVAVVVSSVGRHRCCYVWFGPLKISKLFGLPRRRPFSCRNTEWLREQIPCCCYCLDRLLLLVACVVLDVLELGGVRFPTRADSFSSWPDRGTVGGFRGPERPWSNHEMPGRSKRRKRKGFPIEWYAGAPGIVVGISCADKMDASADVSNTGAEANAKTTGISTSRGAVKKGGGLELCRCKNHLPL